MSNTFPSPIVIWDLFGGSNHSVRKALGNIPNVEIYTFDIQFNPEIPFDEKYMHNVSLIHYVEFASYVYVNNIPKPSFIFASPCCKSFSSLLHVGKDLPDERLGWKKVYEKDEYRYDVREVDEIGYYISKNKFFHHMKKENVLLNAIIGKWLLSSTIEIIENYKPIAWYIENPQKSLMWEVIIKNHKDFWFSPHTYVFNNIAHYSSYNQDYSMKPTNFLSNLWLGLKADKTKSNATRKKGCRLPQSPGKYSKRSEIPKELIYDIFKKMCEKTINKV